MLYQYRYSEKRNPIMSSRTKMSHHENVSSVSQHRPQVPASRRGSLPNTNPSTHLESLYRSAVLIEERKAKQRAALLEEQQQMAVPKINSRSRAIAANLTEEKCDKFYSWKPKSTLPSGPVEPDHSPHSHRPKIDSRSHQISQATGWAAIPLHLRLYEQEVTKRGVRQKELVARAREAEMVQCTFQPNTDTARVALAAALAGASVEKEAGVKVLPGTSLAPVLLHNPGAALFARSASWAVEKESRLREAREAALRKDVEECTFRPALPSGVPRQQRRASISGVGGGGASLRQVPSPPLVAGKGAGGEGRGGRRASVSEARLAPNSRGLQQGRTSLVVSPLRQATAPQKGVGTGVTRASFGSSAASHSQQDPQTQPRPSTLGLDAFVERLKLGRALNYSKKNPALPDGSRWTGEVTRPQAPKLAPGRKGGSRRASVGGGEYAGGAGGGGSSAASAHLWGGRQLVNSLSVGHEDAVGDDQYNVHLKDRGGGSGEGASTATETATSSLPTFLVPSSATAWATPIVGTAPASSSASLPILASIFSANVPAAPLTLPPPIQQPVSVGGGSGAPPSRPPPLPPPVSLRKDASSVEEIKARLRQLESMANSAVFEEEEGVQPRLSEKGLSSLSQALSVKGEKSLPNPLLSRVEAMAQKVAANA